MKTQINVVLVIRYQIWGEQLWFQILCFIVSIWVKLDCHNIYPSLKFRQCTGQKRSKKRHILESFKLNSHLCSATNLCMTLERGLNASKFNISLSLKWYNWSRWPPKSHLILKSYLQIILCGKIITKYYFKD